MKAGKRGDQVEDMRVLERRRALRPHYHRLYAILWLFITFLSIPYFLAAVNLSPSQFFLLGRIFADIPSGIHHGLLGYTTLSIGILGMQSSTYIQRGRTRRYLFFISLFFLAKGMYFFAEDLIGEQIVHHTVERTYLWDWTAPSVEFFTLTVAFVAIWMRDTWTILAMAIPVLFISIFATPCAAITAGYLILLLIYKNEEAGKTPWLTKRVENWKLFRRVFKLAWIILILLSIGMLLTVLGVNL